ncbi:MAG: energy transducer TonB [Burkholderiaceae bacterium]|nr:energy transducer TonB [Burkholderiaceae bacterium]
MPAVQAIGLAVGVSLAVHAALLLTMAGRQAATVPPPAVPSPAPLPMTTVRLTPDIPTSSAPQPAAPPTSLSTPSAQLPAEARLPATQVAPAAPTAEEWAFAARYPLKNSKGYRYHWGQQVRSMMGTAVAGPDQGQVRFRVEIGPDGRLVRLDTLWSTSDVAEQRARAAIEAMPPLPPTPTGRPLVFERTIAFTPFASDDTPLYRHDCEPEPAPFRNPFVWDGRSTPPGAAPAPPAATEALPLAECLKLLPPDSVDAEAARDQRLRDQWDSSTLAR